MHMPWPVAAPFRMRPNLEKLDPVAPALLLRDVLADVYRRERERVIEAHRERAMVGTANDAVLAEISGLAPSPLAGVGWGEGASGQNIALAIQEDFVILKQENDTLRTEYLSVCFPSRWDPREKLGLDFAAIHAPVANNELLLAAGTMSQTWRSMGCLMNAMVMMFGPAACSI